MEVRGRGFPLQEAVWPTSIKVVWPSESLFIKLLIRLLVFPVLWFVAVSILIPEVVLAWPQFSKSYCFSMFL